MRVCAGHRLGLCAGFCAGLALALLACQPGRPAPVTLNVYAASSLTEVGRDLERAFESAHPDIDVVLSFAGSQVLQLQIESGAQADVFASADAAHVQALADAGLVARRERFAQGELALIVPLDNPAKLRSLADLPSAQRLVIGSAAGPVGRYTRELLTLADTHYGPGFEAAVSARVVSSESNVRLARAKVELGEADAAIVYRSDAQASDRVRSLPIPAEINPRADYVMAILEASPEPAAAALWLSFVRSTRGREILLARGFLVAAIEPLES